MTVPLSPPDLANAVTAFCTIGAGVTTLLLCRYVGAQPDRWLRAYLCLFITGIPTLGWHGWGGEMWRVSDIGTNLLLAYVLQLAVLGDYYGATFRRRFTIGSGLVNAFGIAWLIGEGLQGGASNAISFGAHAGFQLGEVVLILDSFAITGLFVARRDKIPTAAVPLLRIVIACFLVGLLLATAAGDVVGGRIGSYHALWHVLGSFGFLFLWAFNHVRIQEEERTKGQGTRAKNLTP